MNEIQRWIKLQIGTFFELRTKLQNFLSEFFDFHPNFPIIQRKKANKKSVNFLEVFWVNFREFWGNFGIFFGVFPTLYFLIISSFKKKNICKKSNQKGIFISFCMKFPALQDCYKVTWHFSSWTVIFYYLKTNFIFGSYFKNPRHSHTKCPTFESLANGSSRLTKFSKSFLVYRCSYKKEFNSPNFIKNMKTDWLPYASFIIRRK
jgi:hypothetical protein